MAKKKGNLYGKVIEYTRTENGTSIGRRPKTSSMNKNKRRSFKKYRGQGKWIRDQASIQMESLYLTKCHKTLDYRKVEGVVVIVGYIQTSMDSAVCIEQKESKIPMFVTSGEKDTLKDNGFDNFKWWTISINPNH